MYTVNKGPSKIVAKTRRGLPQNFEKFESIKESGKKHGSISSSFDLNSPEKNKNIPRPVFQQSFASKRIAPTKLIEDEVITPQHEEIIRYINDSWNILVAQNPYDSSTAKPDGKADANNNSASTLATPSPVDSIIANTPVAASAAPAVWVEPPSPALNDFKPFDLESWWGRRLFHNITKSL
ncbi:MAPK regulated corepressor interacting protein 2 [Drosophila novamexicana]|uniref:Protein FAM195A n=1 Tax=Drosophila virilis TaxID=7244 RepID=B4LH70_DROVI|nr:MAPK regulated corepressor interacting protein 2 [Drosophila virilis]XP_030571058.1 MAPK regulated corepressor interacting protein 2 [Drosophila novamexicana]EDW70583.1 uncharacterized protein Dvir_GJ11457 [Drosophila virilis]